MIDPNLMGEKMNEEEGRYKKRALIPPIELPEEEEEYDAEEEITFGGTQQDEEIMPGVYQSDIDSWKKQFGEIWAVDVKGREFIYRALQRYEYKEILAMPNTDPLMREEMIAEECVIYPVGYDFAAMANDRAGYPAILSEFIMDTSGFTREATVRRL